MNVVTEHLAVKLAEAKRNLESYISPCHQPMFRYHLGVIKFSVCTGQKKIIMCELLSLVPPSRSVLCNYRLSFPNSLGYMQNVNSLLDALCRGTMTLRLITIE